MLLKCLVIFTMALAVQSATIYYHEGRNIPVEIRYEKAEHLDEIPIGSSEKGLQLQEDNQLKLEPTQAKDVEVIKKESLTQSELESLDHLAAIRNLDEKIQLPPQQLAQILKHVPIASELEELEPSNVQEEDNVQLKKLAEVQTTLNNIQHTNTRVELVQQVETFIKNGFNMIRKNFKPQNPNELVPEPELWEKLDKDLSEYFEEEKNKLGGKQDQGGSQQNFFQNLANGIQSISNNFIQSIQGSGANGTQGDEQPGGWQGFVGFFQGGVQNLINSVNNVGGQTSNSNSTVLGDTGSGSQQPPNFISSIFNNVQQIFQGGNQGNNQGVAANGTQSDTGTGTNNPNQQQGGFFAGAISQFNQVVSNIIPGSQSQVPVQGDEGATVNGTSPGNPVQQVIQSFGSSINNAINQFVGGTNNRPQGSEDENNQAPQNQNFIQSIGQNIGNAFQNIQNAFGGSTQNPLGSLGGGSGGGSGGDSNPANAIVGQVQNVGTQLQQLAGQQAGSNPIQNVLPGGSNSGKQPAESTQTPTTAFSSEESPAQTTQSQPNSEAVKSVAFDQPVLRDDAHGYGNQENQQNHESAQPLLQTIIDDQPVVTDHLEQTQEITESNNPILPTIAAGQSIANDQSLEINNEEKQQVTNEEIKLAAKGQSLLVNQQEIDQPVKCKDLEKTEVKGQDDLVPQNDEGLQNAEEINKPPTSESSNIKESIPEKQTEDKDEIMMTAE